MRTDLQQLEAIFTRLIAEFVSGHEVDLQPNTLFWTELNNFLLLSWKANEDLLEFTTKYNLVVSSEQLLEANEKREEYIFYLVEECCLGNNNESIDLLMAKNDGAFLQEVALRKEMISALGIENSRILKQQILGDIKDWENQRKRNLTYRKIAWPIAAGLTAILVYTMSIVTSEKQNSLVSKPTLNNGINKETYDGHSADSSFVKQNKNHITGVALNELVYDTTFLISVSEVAKVGIVPSSEQRINVTVIYYDKQINKLIIACADSIISSTMKAQYEKIIDSAISLDKKYIFTGKKLSIFYASRPKVIPTINIVIFNGDCYLSLNGRNVKIIPDSKMHKINFGGH